MIIIKCGWRMENGRGLRMSKKGSWRKYMPHPKDKDDFDRETAWDMIGILTMIVIFETALIVVLLLYIFLVLI